MRAAQAELGRGDLVGMDGDALPDHSQKCAKKDTTGPLFMQFLFSIAGRMTGRYDATNLRGAGKVSECDFRGTTGFQAH
jgi:hypothetical protein